MRNRIAQINTLEIVVPVLLALALGVGALLFLSPVFGQTPQSTPGVIRIYSSVPLPDYASIQHGIEMALQEANNSAGDFRIEYVSLNDAVQQQDDSWRWSTDVELKNARRAAEDPDAMVYIGTYNSGAAKISIPVLNRVNMAMISPGNTYPGLTKPGTGTAGEPWVYYPLGVRNYFRVLPADDLQGAAAAAYARQIGAKSVYVLDDTELYGKGIATIFASSARELGLNVAGGPESIDVRANDYSNLASRIMQTSPDLVFFGGNASSHPDLVLRDLRNAGFNGSFMGADAMISQTFIDNVNQTGSADVPIYATLPGLPASRLTGPGADWYRQYKSRYPNDNGEDFAPFGYEAAKVALRAIEKAGKKDREAIRQAVAGLGTDDLPEPHILGDWKFDANGDTSLITVSVQRVGQNPESGRPEWLFEGIMSFDQETKTWTLQQE
jgi:branched-chain amino acid transport system substrate-binding protein